MGSSAYITDTEGEVAQHVEYFPFGETFLEEHSNTDRTPYLFNGKELDEETGLYYYGARYYDARTSVWQSVDPLAEQTMTPFVYCNNNPVKLIDPDGKIAILAWIDAVVDVAFVAYDVGVLIHEKVTTGKTSGENWAALAADGASILVPMSVGAGQAVKAGYKAYNKAENAVDAGKAMQKLKKSAETGREAHRQIQKGLKEKGADIEVPMKLKDGTKVRKDAVKSDGTAVIIKPNTPSGQKSAKARENLMQKNGHKTETIFYDPKNPAYQQGSPTYIGPKKKN